ncbi:hypothetical protein ScPMuIL_007392 [Solemya velum]
MTTQQTSEDMFGKQKTEGENLYDNLNSPTFDDSMGGGNDSTPIVDQDPAERERQVNEWKDELIKVESEIVTLKQVLGAKVRYAAELKRKIGITPFQEFRQDLSEGIKSIKESDTYQKTNDRFHQINDKITHTTAYQKTSAVMKTATEKTTSAMSAVGGVMTRKMGDLRNSQTFKSVEEKVEHAYANVKAKVKGSKSEGNFEDALREETAAGNNGGNTPTESPSQPLPEEKIPLSLYELNFMTSERKRGFYKLTVSVSPSKADNRFIGTSGAEVEVKVTSQVKIENVDIGIADKDQSSSARTTKLQHPNKAANVLEADYHQKIIMKFQLKDKTTSQLLTAHQTFVKLTNEKSKKEIIFVAEADSQMTNKFDLDIGASAKDFGYSSGKYTVELIVGDAVIENPFSWVVADVNLKFSDDGADVKEQVDQYKKKKDIEHVFREPEKTPPVVLSTTFTVLVILPILVLVAIWLKLGVNVSQFPMSLSAIGFHICLGLIFGLYYCYWTHLNMFQTLRFLGILSVPTFIFGNRLLSGIAAKRQGQKNKQATSFKW